MNVPAAPATSLSLILLVSACSVLQVHVPEHYPPIPEGASTVRVEGASFDQLRDALIEVGFPVERANAESGIIGTGSLQVEMGPLVRATVNMTSYGAVIRGEWTQDQESRIILNSMGGEMDYDWEPVAWNDWRDSKMAMLKLIEVGLAVPDGTIEIR